MALRHTLLGTALRVLESHAHNERPSCVLNLAFAGENDEVTRYGVFIYNNLREEPVETVTAADPGGTVPKRLVKLCLVNWYDDGYWVMRNLQSGEVPQEARVVYEDQLPANISSLEHDTETVTALLLKLFDALSSLPCYGKGLV